MRGIVTEYDSVLSVEESAMPIARTLLAALALWAFAIPALAQP
jgi:hypothetical protein